MDSLFFLGSPVEHKTIIFTFKVSHHLHPIYPLLKATKAPLAPIPA